MALTTQRDSATRYQTASSGTRASAHRGPEHLTVDEAIERYPNQWIVMCVTAEEHGWPSAGFVMGHYRSNKRASDKRCQIFRDVIDLPGPVYMFPGYAMIRTVDEARKALADLAPDPARWRE